MVVFVLVIGCAPIAGVNSRAMTPDQASCSLPPREFEDIQRLRAQTVNVEIVRPMDSAGVRVTAAVQVEIAALVREFLTCSAAGEPLRVWSLYSDPYLTRLLGRERGYDRARYEMDSVAMPLEPGDRPVLRSLTRVSAQGEDRVMANTIIWYPNLEREKNLAWSFVRVAGEWKIDEIDGEITFAVP